MMRDDAPLPTGTRVRQQGGGRLGTIEVFARATMMYWVGYDDGAWEGVAWADVRLVSGCMHEVLQLSREERMVASEWAARSEQCLRAVATQFSKKEMQKP